MYKFLKHILFSVCFMASVVTFSQTAKVSEITTLSVLPKTGYGYVWELYDSSVDFAKTAGNCPPSKAVFIGENNSPQVQVQWLEAGTYYYKVSVNDGCSTNTKIGIITITGEITPPKIQITYDCHKGTAQLEASEYTGTLLWSTGETTQSIEVDTHNIPKGNTMPYWVQQSVNGVQSSRTEVSIERNTKPNSPDTSNFPTRIYIGESVSLAGVSCGEDQVQWFTDAALTQEITTSEINPTQNTIYYVVCKTDKGCQSEAITLLLEVIIKAPCDDLFENMFIPNGFSPNNDGVNDTWEVEDLKKYYINCNQKNTVRIFNRWGAKVYEKENYMLDDQRFQGFSQHERTVSKKPLPNGTYFFIITFEDGKQKSGYLYMRKDTEFDL